MSVSQRPLIGVVAAHFPRGNGTTLSGIGQAYLRAIEAAGGIPTMLHLTDDPEVLQRLYQPCAGILFCGGGDIDPAYYGQKPHPQLGEIEAFRDRVELRLAEWVVADHKPTLGICRGAQLLNVALGGTLYQDLGSELPDALEHRESAQLKQRSHIAHPLRLSANSWLAERLGTTELGINTLHHQAVREVGHDLRVVGYAPDGVVEAFESTNDQFMVAVQCHPEELWEQADPRWLRMFQGFIEEVQRRS